MSGQSNGQPTISSPHPASAPYRVAAEQPANLLPHAPHYTLRRTLPNTPLAVSFISALLGGLAVGSLALAARPVFEILGAREWGWARSRLGMYGAAMGMFHLLEFWTTAGWNPQKLSVDAFLLNNTNQYHYAHAFGLAEYFISSFFVPHKYDEGFWNLPYLAAVTGLLVGAQVLRSLAMVHASASFSHVVKSVKHDDHELITHGVYRWSRHPSYAGFFYWALATQLLLGNIISTLGFSIVLGRFFSARINDEEKHLVRFFGDEYVQYRKRVGTGLPFFISNT